MTNAEYKKLLQAADESINSLSIDTLRRVRTTYINIADNIAAAVKIAELEGKSQLTTTSMSVIEAELRRSSEVIEQALQKDTPELINKSYQKIYIVDKDYIMSAVDDADITRITAGQLDTWAVMINNRLNISLANRIWQDGYTFSERCFNTGQRYQKDIKNILEGGLFQGRDPVQIAKDITEYSRKGKKIIEGRWGRLKPGVREYYNRIPKNVDYRAMRLVRSELHASLQQAGKEEGRLNPGCTGWYDWILEPNDRPPGDPCPDIAASSPYALEEIPDFPHPNSYIEGTEVYTDSGWKDFRNVSIVEDRFLTLNQKSLEYEWVDAVLYNKHHIKDNLIEMKSNSFHMITTKEHRNYGKNTYTKHKWFTSDEVHSGKMSYYAIPRHGNWLGKKYDKIKLGNYEIQAELYCEFMGYFLSEGCIARCSDRKNFGTISQQKEESKKIIIECMKKLPFPVVFGKKDFTFRDESVCEELEDIGYMCWNFKIPEIILTMESRLIKIFLDAFILGDGSERKTNGLGIKSYEKIVLTSSDAMASQIGELILKAGGYPSYYKQEAKEVKHKNGTYLTKHPCWRITWNRSRYSYKRNSPRDVGKGIKTKEMPYDGLVYDVELEKNHILWVRYNGKTCFSGNCSCRVQPELRDREIFIDDLTRWANGESVDYLDAWEEQAQIAGLTI